MPVELYEVQERTPLLIQTLTQVWEDSVRATHLFLSDAAVRAIKEWVPQAFYQVPHLAIAEQTPGCPIALMGIAGSRLEMLFLAPAVRGAGLGRKLLEYGMERYGIQEVAVNEQNPQAVGFYQHMGFEVYRRTDCDEQGNPYPLLYLKRKRISG